MNAVSPITADPKLQWRSDFLAAGTLLQRARNEEDQLHFLGMIARHLCALNLDGAADNEVRDFRTGIANAVEDYELEAGNVAAANEVDRVWSERS